MTVLITDEIDVAIDPLTGDIPAEGDLTMTTGIAAVVQGARIRINMIAGEWFANLRQGVAWYPNENVEDDRVILGRKFNRIRAIREIRNVLLGTPEIAGVPGIVELIRLEATFDDATRVLTVTWQARTEFGDTPVDTLIKNS